MTTASIFLYYCAGFACIGVGFAGFGFLIAILSRRVLFKQCFSYTYYPNRKRSSRHLQPFDLPHAESLYLRCLLVANVPLFCYTDPKSWGYASLFATYMVQW